MRAGMVQPFTKYDQCDQRLQSCLFLLCARDTLYL